MTKEGKVTDEEKRKYLADTIERIELLARQFDSIGNDYVLGQLHAASNVLKFVESECSMS